MMGRALCASLALPLVLTLTSSSLVTADGEGAGGPLLPCGTSGGSDPAEDSMEVISVFKFVKGVCTQRGEACPAGQILPTSCASAECQRAVRLAADSCGPAFAHDGFLQTAFGRFLDATVAVCAADPQRADTQVRSRDASCLSPRYFAANSRYSVWHSATSSPATARSAIPSRWRHKWVGC